MLAVLVSTDAASQLLEKATYCKPGDELRPLVVGLPDFTTTQVCPDSGDPDPVDSAYPDGWYVRIMFDELLDPSFESLTPVVDEDTGEETGSYTGSIADSHPVKLECRSITGNQFVNVDYDGYYSPSGNRVTWPVGPSIVIKPNDPTVIATNTECQVTILDVVTDKQGNPVPENERGPFPFKIAPITVVTIDPVDDPDYDNEDFVGVDAVQLWYDNLYVQFNTAVDFDSLCPDEDSDGLCDDDKVFSFKDLAHPEEGPGYCDDAGGSTCGSLADCPTGSTICGKGYCGVSGDPCNKESDCPTGEHCGTTYAYDNTTYGGLEREIYIGSANPLQTDRQYLFSFTPNVMLTDRCGRASTLATAMIEDDDDFRRTHFRTNEFDLNETTILDGEVASATRRLEFDFNNVLEGSDGYTSDDAVIPSPAITAGGSNPMLTITPLPKIMTAACPGGGASCASVLQDIPLDNLVIVSPLYNGQAQLAGHYAMNTDYTVTLKAGAVVKDFYGATWTNDTAADMVIHWKTQPAIQLTGIAVRDSDTSNSIGDEGTLTKDGEDIDFRFTFNASIDPTTFDASDFKIEGPADVPAITAFTFAATGCGSDGVNTVGDPNLYGWYPACTMKARVDQALLPEGTYKITFLKGAKVKDIFGTEYTQPEDKSITIDVEEAAPVVQCL